MHSNMYIHNINIQTSLYPYVFWLMYTESLYLVINKPIHICTGLFVAVMNSSGYHDDNTENKNRW